MDELVLLPEIVALQRHFDARSYRAFLWILGFATLFSGLGLAAALLQAKTFLPIIFGLNLLVSLALIAARHEPFFERAFRWILLGFLSLQIVLPQMIHWGGETRPWSFIGVYTIFFCFLRLRPSEHLLLFIGYWISTLWHGWRGDRVANGEAVSLFTFGGFELAITALVISCLILALTFNHLEKRKFVSGWRREYSRYRERQRLRDEIDHARRIQLSMLPQKAPDLPWLEIAAVSLPAAEVGGDYYEFFPLADSKLAVVVGDVAGHGLASGLMLSGLRSCLHLLDDELGEPKGVFARINRMVRRTTDRRTFVTLACAVLDRAGGEIKLASAGHPPILHWSQAEKKLEQYGGGFPPLGTALPTTYEEETRALGVGDVLVLYTDGLIEARDREEREYGDERLERAVARLAATGKAREIRDAILSDLSNFKGDQEQLDDLTLIVLRLKAV